MKSWRQLCGECARRCCSVSRQLLARRYLRSQHEGFLNQLVKQEILSQYRNTEETLNNDIFNSGSQSSSAVAGSILPSPYSPCTKVKIRFFQKGTHALPLSSTFVWGLVFFGLSTEVHTIMLKWYWKQEAVRSEQTCCRKGGRRKEGGGRSQASGRSGRQSGKTTVVSCRWVLVPFSQLWCSFVLYQNCEHVPSMQHACCVQQCRFSDHMWYQCGLSCKRAKTYETLAIFYTFFYKDLRA